MTTVAQQSKRALEPQCTVAGDRRRHLHEHAVTCADEHVPLDINDPDGRFGTWMPGDDADDWR